MENTMPYDKSVSGTNEPEAERGSGSAGSPASSRVSSLIRAYRIAIRSCRIYYQVGR